MISGAYRPSYEFCCIEDTNFRDDEDAETPLANELIHCRLRTTSSNCDPKPEVHRPMTLFHWNL